MSKRSTRRSARSRPAPKATSTHRSRLQARVRAFVTSFTPNHFRAYWLSRAGLGRVLRLAGSAFLLLFLVLLFFAKDLPSPSKINAKVSAQTTMFYDRTGKTVLYEVHGDQNRTVIDIAQIPEQVKHATVAIEDKNFYNEGAFSFIGILRAVMVDVIHRGAYQGGSTITQQYVKNALLDPADHSFTRKIKELILSLEIGQFYSKNDILKLYLNEIPYGSQAYGIQAAAKTFFTKDAKDLTLPEAAILAAIPQAPTYYSPYGQHVTALLDRQHLVLDLMAQQHYISQQQANDAKKVDILAEIPKVPQLFANVTAPYFVKYLEAQLDQKYSQQRVDTGGLHVITTLDLTKQAQAEAAVNSNMGRVHSLGGSNAALVAADPKTGQVLAWVGGNNFTESQVDVAVANRQPGSSFKPFVYSTLFGKNTGTTYGAGTTLYDVLTDFGGGYTPRNYCQCNYGVVSVRQALGNSLNIPAVKTLYLAGVGASIDTAHKLGITTLKEDPGHYSLTLVLGSGEVKLADMVNAYGSFATGGNHAAPQTILKITDAHGTVLEDNTKPPTLNRVLDPQVVYVLNSILSDPGSRTLTFGSNFSPLIIPGKTTAVKTGTTENFRDAWTVGYTQSLVAGVWAGNNDGHGMSGSSGAVAAPIWHDFMLAATKDAPNEPFVRPDGIKEVTLDTNTGRLPGPDSKATRTDIFPSWYKPAPYTDSKSAKVDKLSSKLATDCTPALALQTVYANDIHAEIPPTDPAYGRWEPPVLALAQKLGYQAGGSLPTQSDDVHHCDDTKPKVNLTASAQGGGVYTLKSNVTSGTFTANKLEVYFDDQIISTQTINGSTTYEFDYTATSNGAHTFKAVVTDSGLYQGEDDQNVTVNSVGNGAFHNTSPADGSNQSAGVITFVWTADPDASGYDLWVDGSLRQANIPTTTFNYPVITTGVTHHWFVRAHNNADQTIPYAFTVS